VESWAVLLVVSLVVSMPAVRMPVESTRVAPETAADLLAAADPLAAPCKAA